MFWYRQHSFIASSLRRISFIGKSFWYLAKEPKTKHFALAAIIFATACREPFVPELRPAQTNFLVVEGFINAQGSTTIMLSRTTPLRDSGSVKREQGATVTIMGEDNSTFQLLDNGGGQYRSDSLALNANQKYRVLIKTAEGKEYLSDYVAVKPTPPIDSISWENQPDGVHIFANSHDPENKTLYYKWDYVETWEIDSHYEASYKYFHGPAPDGSRAYVTDRDPAEVLQMKYCWKNVVSSNIHVGSSVSLASDIISREPVIFIPHGSEKIGVKYSILVKQYALDKQGYEFYQLMKKNTEATGSIFDAQPSDISGNVHSTNNPEEKVIGYVTAATTQEKRIFITNAEVMTAEWGYERVCKNVYVVNVPDSINIYLGGGSFIPYSEKGRAEGYYSISADCADCRLGGGNNDKPSFW